MQKEETGPMAERELQKNEFAVLAALERDPGASQRSLKIFRKSI